MGTAAAIVSENGWAEKQTRAFKRTAIPPDPDKVIEDLIWRDFTSAALGNRLAGDTNYLRTDEVRQYLATVIDLWHPAWTSAGRWPITCESPRAPEC